MGRWAWRTGGEASSAMIARRRPGELGFRATAGEARPSRVLGSSSGYYGRARGHWFDTAARGVAMSPAVLMAGGSGRCVLGRATEERMGKFYRRVEAVPPHRCGLQEFQHG
jgi:hypothetical protein